MKVFNFEVLKEDVVSKTNEIAMEDIKPNAKTNKMMGVASEAMKQLNFVYGNVFTLKNQVSKVRMAIADGCPVHHMFWSNLDALKKSEPWLAVPSRLDINESTTNKSIAAKFRAVSELAQELAIKCEKEGDAKKRDEYLNIKSKLDDIKIFSETYYRVNITKEQSQMIKETSKTKLDEKLRTQTTIGITQLIGLIHELLKSDRMYDLALGVALATGRRSTEVFCTAEFELVDKYKVSFKGQLKKQFWQGKKDIEYFIYTLVPAELVIKAHERLRNYDVVKTVSETYKETKDVTIVNRKFARSCGMAAKRHLTQFDPARKFTFKDSRSIWGAVALDLFFDNDEWEGCAKEVFLQHQYGHDTPMQQLDYLGFSVVDNKPFQAALKKDEYIIDSDFLASIDDDVIESADSDKLGFKASLLLDAHIKTQEFVEVYGAFNHGRTIYKKTRKMGGIGITAYIANAYIAIIEKKLNDK